jgi:hypothetical protein
VNRTWDADEVAHSGSGSSEPWKSNSNRQRFETGGGVVDWSDHWGVACGQSFGTDLRLGLT